MARDTARWLVGLALFAALGAGPLSAGAPDARHLLVGVTLLVAATLVAALLRTPTLWVPQAVAAFAGAEPRADGPIRQSDPTAAGHTRSRAPDCR